MPIRLTKAVKLLLISGLAAFVIQQSVDQFLGGNLLGWLALIPSDVVGRGRIWQLITYMFLHGDVMHLFLNLLMIAFIGSELETLWGTARFLKYYFFCGVMAGILYLILQVFFLRGTGLHIPMVGASGGIYGLLIAYGILFGERVMLFMLLFPMKAKHFIWILAGVEFFSTVFSGRSGLAGVAHLGGMAAGFGYLWGRARWNIHQKERREGKVAARKAKSRAAGKHLKLIIDNDKDFEKKQDETPKDPKTWH